MTAQEKATPPASSGMWGGRFSTGPSAIFRAINDSLPVDWRLVQQDIAGSRAWATAIMHAGVLSAAERDAIHGALDAIAEDAAALERAPVESGAEDVHTWVEQKLIEQLGPLGKKLHTGRSRNDQVATDLRLWAKDAAEVSSTWITALQHSLAKLAKAESNTPFPAFTHLQPAQPIVFGHWCLAYAEMLERDLQRVRGAIAVNHACPLGSAALAGSAYPIDRAALAIDLGFDAASGNSLDAVSDRDIACDLLHAWSLCAVHLSRLAEDLIVYLAMGLVMLDDRVTSGSSIMPQKKNPDALELIRGKSAAMLALEQRLLITLKGLPTAYNKDLQDDKAIIFEAFDTIGLVLAAAAEVVESTVVNANVAKAAAIGGHANATDLADFLVDRGVPFRDAHEQVGELVRLADERGIRLEQFTQQDMAPIAPMADGEVAASLTVEACLARRDVHGGTAPTRVAMQAQAWLDRLSAPSSQDGYA